MGVVIHIDTRQLDITHLHGNKYIDLFSRAKGLGFTHLVSGVVLPVDPFTGPLTTFLESV